VTNRRGHVGALCYDHAFHELSAEQFASYLHEIKARYPAMIIGVYAPFPFKSTEDIRQRLVAWDILGARPDFIRMDVDYNQRERYTDAVHRQLLFMCADRSLPLQVVINARESVNDATYVREATAWADRCLALGFDAYMVQSWASTPSDYERYLPHNLPESDASSHTSLLRYCLERFV
jgi:hypothetical protein